MKFDLYGALMINHRNRDLIVFHLYRRNKHKLSMIFMEKIRFEPCLFCHIHILIQNVAQVQYK